MPEAVFGIPTHYALYAMALWVAWAAFFGKHNRILARLALTGLAIFLAVPFYIAHQGATIGDYPVLSMIGSLGFLTFLVVSVAWSMLDITPIYRKLLRRNNP